jgi:hypothetical protein
LVVDDFPAECRYFATAHTRKRICNIPRALFQSGAATSILAQRQNTERARLHGNYCFTIILSAFIAGALNETKLIVINWRRRALAN